MGVNFLASDPIAERLSLMRNTALPTRLRPKNLTILMCTQAILPQCRTLPRLAAKALESLLTLVKQPAKGSHSYANGIHLSAPAKGC